ncbi:MAG: hypothetical protein MI673_01065, partial [Thiotrichales bacterium]|nr:hypothetical protein [Thiotrichales bacterium]
MNILSKKIQNYILENKFEFAIKICDQILKINRKDFYANITKANLLAEIGFHKKSLSYYYKALKIIPDDPTVLFNLAT